MLSWFSMHTRLLPLILASPVFDLTCFEYNYFAIKLLFVVVRRHVQCYAMMLWRANSGISSQLCTTHWIYVNVNMINGISTAYKERCTHVFCGISGNCSFSTNKFEFHMRNRLQVILSIFYICILFVRQQFHFEHFAASIQTIFWGMKK